MELAHVLIADITGSTELYDTLPQQDALRVITNALAGMREVIQRNGGHCVKSQGDGTLSVFPQADHAFCAAQTMIAQDWQTGLGVHAGASCGEVLSQDDDIYGDPVNTAARLAGLAKPGEILVDGAFFAKLTPFVRSLCVPLGQLPLKGKRDATPVHSYADSDIDTQTVVAGNIDRAPDSRLRSVLLECNGNRWTLRDGSALLVGRSRDCHVVMNHPWVSRQHGSFELRAGQLEFTDHSSTGSTIIGVDGRQTNLHRKSMLLDREGIVLCGTSDVKIAGSVVQYSLDDLVTG